MKVKICVTEEDIKNGKFQSDSECPTALALRRELNDPSCDIHVEDGNTGIYIENRVTGEVLRAERGYRVIEDFIKAFDSHEPVTPFEVEIDLELDLPEYDDGDD